MLSCITCKGMRLVRELDSTLLGIVYGMIMMLRSEVRGERYGEIRWTDYIYVCYLWLEINSHNTQRSYNLLSSKHYIQQREIESGRSSLSSDNNQSTDSIYNQL